MAVTTTYTFQSVEVLDEGAITGDTDAVGLTNGGVVVVGNITPGFGGPAGATFFQANGDPGGARTDVDGAFAAVSQLSNGNIVVATDTGNLPAVLVLNQGSGVVVGPTILSTGQPTCNDVDVAGGLAGGRFAVAFETFLGSGNHDVRIVICNNDTTQVAGFAVDGTTASDRKPSVAALNDGGFAVAWHRVVPGATELWYAIYEGDGTVRKAATRLDDDGSINRNASVVAMENGGFAIAYEDNQWSSDIDISVARINATGTTVAITDVTENLKAEADPSLTRLSNGMLAVGTTSTDADGSDPLWILIDEETGARLGGTATGDTAGDNTDTAVAGTALGQMAVFFTDSLSGDVIGRVLQGVRTSTGDGANDTIVGDELRDVISGGAGNDTITGGGGGATDELSGGAGNDTFRYAAGDEASSETVDGGTGLDRIVTLGAMLDFAGVIVTSIEEIEFSAVGDFTKQVRIFASSVGNGLAFDTLIDGNATSDADILRVDMFTDTNVNLSAFQFTGWNSAGSENDRVLIFGDADAETIVGSIVRDDISGGGGNDLLDGGLGGDVLLGGAGNDIIDGGGSALDAVDFRDKTVAVVLTLAAGVDAIATVGGVAQDTVRNVEQVFGGSGADVLTGDAFGNLLIGFNGNDILKGAGGGDNLYGEAGFDFVDYRDKALQVSVTLNGATNAAVSVGGVVEDSVRSVEGVFGGAAADALTGDALGNQFRGGGGPDLINGAGGSDFIDFRDKTTAVVLTLAGAVNATATVGGVTEDVVRNVENIFGGAGADKLTGDLLANQLFGNGGNDLLKGGIGADQLTGGANADIFFINSLAESTNGAAGRDTIFDFSRAEGDRIFLQVIDANTGVAGDQAFVVGALGVAGQLQITALNATTYLVQGDVNGGGSDFGILVNSAVALAAQDFVL